MLSGETVQVLLLQKSLRFSCYWPNCSLNTVCWMIFFTWHQNHLKVWNVESWPPTKIIQFGLKSKKKSELILFYSFLGLSFFLLSFLLKELGVEGGEREVSFPQLVGVQLVVIINDVLRRSSSQLCGCSFCHQWSSFCHFLPLNSHALQLHQDSLSTFSIFGKIQRTTTTSV